MRSSSSPSSSDRLARVVSSAVWPRRQSFWPRHDEDTFALREEACDCAVDVVGIARSGLRMHRNQRTADGDDSSWAKGTAF